MDSLIPCDDRGFRFKKCSIVCLCLAAIVSLIIIGMTTKRVDPGNEIPDNEKWISSHLWLMIIISISVHLSGILVGLYPAFEQFYLSFSSGVLITINAMVTFWLAKYVNHLFVLFFIDILLTILTFSFANDVHKRDKMFSALIQAMITLSLIDGYQSVGGQRCSSPVDCFLRIPVNDGSDLIFHFPSPQTRSVRSRNRVRSQEFTSN